MTSIIRPIAGSVATFASCGFTAADFNSLAAAGCAVMPTSAAIDNTVNLDDYLTVSYSLVVGATTTTASFLSLFLLPLNQDGSTYGDGTVTGTAQPGVSYWLTNSFVRSGVASGSAVVGSFPAVWLPRAKFVLAIGNNLGGALNAAAAASVSYLTTNLNANG